jgi:hypothetical protein
MKQFFAVLVFVACAAAGCSAKHYPRPRLWPPASAPSEFRRHCPSNYDLVYGTPACETGWACWSLATDRARCIDRQGIVEPHHT